MTTTQDIMKLARTYAKAYMSFQEAGELRALESAVEALVSERNQLKDTVDRLADINRDALSNINMLADAKNAEIDQLSGERDALVKRLLALANCEANELADALTEAAMTLDTLTKERDALQARLDDVGRQEPVAWLVEGLHEPKVIARQLHFAIDEANKTASEFVRHYPTVNTKPLYTHPAPQAAAPQPLTEDQLMDAYCTTAGIHQFIEAFKAGARFAEAAHRIGAKP